MSITTEILNLRREKASSVTALLALIEWERNTQKLELSSVSAITAAKVTRHHAVLETADLVLLNVAAHAADQLIEPPTGRKTRRTLFPFRRKPRRSDPGQLRQRMLV